VCDRVGKTLVITAVLWPDCESCNAALIPAPPPPTISPSKVIVLINLNAPNYSNCPKKIY
jgi:hypothetical protein